MAKNGINFQNFSKTHLVHLYFGLVIYVCCEFGENRSFSFLSSAVYIYTDGHFVKKYFFELRGRTPKYIFTQKSQLRFF